MKKLFIAIGFIFLLATYASATVNVEDNRIQYLCDGVVVTYAYDFLIYEDDDLTVTQGSRGSTPNTLVLNTDYTVTGAGDTGGGNVVLDSASECSDGAYLTITRDVELTQDTDYVDGQMFSAESLETLADKLTLVQQDQQEKIDRSPRVPQSANIGSLDLDIPVSAGRVWGWNTGGTGVTTYSTGSAQAQATFDTLSNYADLATACAALSAGDNLIIDSAAVIADGVTVTCNNNLIFNEGTIDGIAGGGTETLTINGNIDAGAYQIFGSNVTVTGTPKIDKIYANWFKTNTTPGTTDMQSAIQSATTWSDTAGVPVQLLAETYYLGSAVTVPGGAVVQGIPTSRKDKETIIAHDQAIAFDTDSTDSDFQGIVLRDMRFITGKTATYAIESHYPHTEISGIQIENVTGDYAGNGIRLNWDDSTASMGAWGSTIRDCYITLKDDATNKRTAIDLWINGGDVQVEKVTVNNAEVAVNIHNGQNIEISDCNFNDIHDHTDAQDAIVTASVIVGEDTSGADTGTTQGVTIRNNYFESHTRAVLIWEAYSTSIQGNYINDNGDYDPTALNHTVGIDGTIKINSLADGVSLKDNYMVMTYQKQLPVVATAGSNLRGWTSENNLFYVNRGANAYSGYTTQFWGDSTNQPYLVANTTFKKTISSADSYIQYEMFSNKRHYDFDSVNINPLATATPTTLFTLATGEIWEIYCTQYDDGTRFTHAIAHKEPDGTTSVITELISGAATTLTVSTHDVQVTQTSGVNRNFYCYWNRKY